MLLLEDVQLPQQARVVFLEFADLGLEFLISEGRWFDVFVHYPLYLYDLLHDFFHLNRSFDVNWLDLHLFLDLLSLL